MDNVVDRHVFYISDGTAITAEVLGHAVMSQFPVTISSITLPFVENESRARAVKDQIDTIYQHIGASAVANVAVGERVTRGQCVADVPPGALGAPIHASIDGVVSAISEQAITVVRG